MKLWISETVEEVVYEQDLRTCCRRGVRGGRDEVECLSCGSRWRAVVRVQPEECAFMEPVVQERKGAA